MNRFLTLVLAPLLLILSIAPGFAGDFAKRHIHGFTPDGRLFAFEEYGRQDGSGFPYATIYVIDTTTDQWTANSPYSVRLEDETKDIYQAREEAKILAGPVMKSFEDRGNIIATNRSTEMGIDQFRMLANPRAVVPPIDEQIEFRLKEITFPSSELCEAFGPSKGFKLTKIATNPNQTTRIIHEDTNVPGSRNCPLSYELADLVTYFPEGSDPVAAVIIRMRTVGFEGPDGRYLAVTTPLN